MSSHMKTNASDIEALAHSIRREPGVIETDEQREQIDFAVKLLEQAAKILREIDKEVWSS